jgi:hypothetical protein
MDSFLTKIPTEVRIMIYENLVPDQPVKSRAELGQALRRQDGSSVSTSMFRVCRQIHEEYADAFYGAQPFEIEIWNDRRQLLTALCLGQKEIHEIFVPRSSLYPAYFQRIRELHLVGDINMPDQSVLPPGDTAEERAQVFYDYLVKMRASVSTRMLRAVDVPFWVPLRRVRISLNVNALGQLILGGDRFVEDAYEHLRELLEPLRELRARRVGVECLVVREEHGFRETRAGQLVTHLGMSVTSKDWSVGLIGCQGQTRPHRPGRYKLKGQGADELREFIQSFLEEVTRV